MAGNSALGARRRKLVVRTILVVIGLGLIVLAVLKGSLSWQDDVKYALFACLALVAANELMRQRAREDRAAAAEASAAAEARVAAAAGVDGIPVADSDASGAAEADVDPDRQG
ncbi:MAG: hypothetical protein ABI345_01370 [Jatrophihabitans sp.]